MSLARRRDVTTTALKDFGATLEKLGRFRSLGVSIALDDFGTGYSSLTYLRHLPIHTLKLDRSFIESVTRSDRDRAIITAVLGLARGLNLEAVVEGVETEDQLAFLRSTGCETVQGFLLGRPVPPEELAARWTKGAQRAGSR